MAPPPSSNTASPGDDLAGRVLAGRYRLERPIASGGMAQVWEATDQTLARRVAVKILHPHLARDEAFIQRFRGEAIAAGRLAHPSIVSVYDTVEDHGLNAIVMELVRGTTMRSDLDDHGPLQLSAVLAIGSQVADALGAAHASGLVHRDVKPANILLSSDGRVLVADFGIAKAAQGADLTSEGSMVGTAKYLAPEQIEGGPVDGRTDLYALGVVLYEALTGTPPFTADTDTGTALARLHRDPTPPRQLRPQIPVAVEQVVCQAMARRPEHRFANAAAMRRALLQAGANPTKAPAVAQAAVAANPDHGLVPSPGHAPAHPAPGHPAPPARQRPVPPSPRPHEQVERVAARPRRRRWSVLVLMVLVLAGLAVATVIRVAGTSGDPGRALTIADVVDFDPNGDNGGEHPEELPAITDGNPDTSWSTEPYRSADVARFKGGVGVIATVERPSDLRRLTVETPEGGWDADVYVIDGPTPDRIQGWGTPVASVDEASTGTVEVDLGGRRGSSVLLWFTTLVPDGDRFVARIGSLELRGS